MIHKSLYISTYVKVLILSSLSLEAMIAGDAGSRLVYLFSQRMDIKIFNMSETDTVMYTVRNLQ